MTAIHLHLTGPLRIADASGTPLPGLGLRAQAILAYLACQPDMRADRARLADLVWSDRGAAQARASLRQELSVLRRALPDGALQADRQAAWLDRGMVRVDRSAGAPFLDGFDLGSEGFEDWLRRMRAADDAPPDTPPRRAGDRPTLAVLAFDDLRAEDGGMMAEGVVEEITGALSRTLHFDVIARQSSFALRGQALSVPEMAAKLGAGYLLEGSVQRAGERVRISVQLVRGADGHVLWVNRFDDRLDDLFALQDRVAMQVAGQLSPNLREAEIARARTQPPEDRSAYDFTLTALPHFWAHRKEANARAVALLDQALARDPDYAPAIAYKAWALAQQPSYMWSDDPPADHAAALDLAERAALRAGNHAPTLVALSAAFSLSSDDGERSRDYARRALAIDPSNAWGWMRLGWADLYANALDTSLAAFEQAEALSPLDPFRFNFLFGKSAVHRSEGRFDLAIAEIHEGLRASPGTTWAYRMLVGTHLMAGDADAADAAARIFLGHYPHVTLEYLRACWPRAIKNSQPAYYHAFQKAFERSRVPRR